MFHARSTEEGVSSNWNVGFYTSFFISFQVHVFCLNSIWCAKVIVQEESKHKSFFHSVEDGKCCFSSAISSILGFENFWTGRFSIGLVITSKQKLDFFLSYFPNSVDFQHRQNQWVLAVQRLLYLNWFVPGRPHDMRRNSRQPG